MKLPRPLRASLRRARDGFRQAQASLESARRSHHGTRLFRQHLAEFPAQPRVAVIGAAGGMGKWKTWTDLGFVQGIGFEPDPAECARLRQKFPQLTFHQAALGNRTGEADFHVAEDAECSSCLKPDMEVLAPYEVAHAFRVQRMAKVQLYRFDELPEGESVEVPQFLQVDVQGYEYEVFDGFGRHLDQVLAIECESHFKPLYRGEKTIHDVIAYLETRGFILRHLQGQGWFGGEWVEVNAFFVRLTRPEEKEKRALIRLWEWVCQLPPRLGAREGL